MNLFQMAAGDVRVNLRRRDVKVIKDARAEKEKAEKY
jgi:hypothetical protein